LKTDRPTDFGRWGVVLNSMPHGLSKTGANNRYGVAFFPEWIAFDQLKDAVARVVGE
jgi:hypothetical protein